MRLVAHHVGAEVHARSPPASAELPETREWFEGLFHAVFAGPAFAIGKPAVAVFTLDDYVAARTRVAIIKDTREFQCAASNLVSVRTNEGIASLSNLVRSSLRLRHDRMPIREVRGLL